MNILSSLFQMGRLDAVSQYNIIKYPYRFIDMLKSKQRSQKETQINNKALHLSPGIEIFSDSTKIENLKKKTNSINTSFHSAIKLQKKIQFKFLIIYISFLTRSIVKQEGSLVQKSENLHLKLLVLILNIDTSRKYIFQ